MKKVPFVTLDKLQEITAQFPTPFHLYDEKGIRENAKAVKEAFAWNKGFKEFFAVKATPNPFLIQILQEYGCGCDCSSMKELMHGKKKLMYKTGESQLFKGLPDTFAAARYHSLAALKDTLPAELKVTAESEDGEVMAVEHTKYPVFGVQFHPESVMTPDGRVMIENFMEVVRND